MRLFIAIDFAEIKDYFDELQEKVPKTKASYPKEYHMTLKFLGETDEKKVDEIKERLSRIRFEPFKVSLGKIGVFPSESFIRVVWVDVAEGSKITRLQKQVESALEGMFKKDARFYPHITFVRVKFIPNEKKKDFIEALNDIKIEPKEIEVRSIKLIKSELTPEGPVYDVLGEFP